ncbi:MAG: TrmH family RNA methyltransferase, partial [Thermodesulfovibrio sp.]
MKWIQSIENPFIKEIRRIKKQPNEKIFIEGINLIESALESCFVRIEKVLVTKQFMEKYGEKFFQDKELEIVGISEEISKKISDTVTPQGIFSVASFKMKNLNEVKNPTLITIVDKVQDPGNLGTIIRASEALGADAVLIIPGTCNPLSGKVLRASAGSIFFIPVIKASVRETEEFIAQCRLTLVITDLKAKLLCFDMDYTQPIAVAFGNES